MPFIPVYPVSSQFLSMNEFIGLGGWVKPKRLSLDEGVKDSEAFRYICETLMVSGAARGEA